ncbi:hypothetical protein [Kitasatospora kifunensis]|uniref:Uncharacterized protein n=1 Tax=Kitasatospora kifunensis TaxID=58351 RepID=A0A7W7RBY9_KITKI|nr:hypothetical protein [Kitasatospora kifunensis]MBB4929163.1 hypothetical protein [Kitasatospora kifunensis]
MSTAPEPQDRTAVLLLPASEDVLGPLLRLEEPLLWWLRPDGDPDDFWELPEGLDGEAVYQAYNRVLDALPGEVIRLVNTGLYELPLAVQPIAPDGRWEHAPLYVVEVASADVTVLARLGAELRRALSSEPGTAGLREFLDQVAEWRSSEDPSGGPVTTATVVREALQGVAVLLQEQGLPEELDGQIAAADPGRRAVLERDRQARADTVLLTDLVRAHGPGERVVLSPAEDAAYRRITNRLIRSTSVSAHAAAETRFTF